MGLSKLKNKLFPLSSGSQPHDAPEIIGGTSDKSTFQSNQHVTTIQASTWTTSQPADRTAEKKPWTPWMPKEPLTQQVAQPSPRDNAAELTEREKDIEERMGVSNAEKATEAEERRKSLI